MKTYGSNRVRGGGTYICRRRSGLTLIELIVAALILTISMIGLLSAWIFAVSHSIETDTRTAAYECARLVMERARSIGYLTPQSDHLQVPQLASRAANIPLTNSQPDANDSLVASTWQSPAIQDYRLFDTELKEVGSGNNTLPALTAATAYVATTQVSFTGQRPGDANGGCQATPPSAACRDDLDQMTIIVTVQHVESQGALSQPLITLQTIVSVGGI